MAGRKSEADQVRQRRLVFERAVRDGVQMREARDALAIERWKAVESRLSRCGTRNQAHAGEASTSDAPSRPRPWWIDQ